MQMSIREVRAIPGTGLLLMTSLRNSEDGLAYTMSTRIYVQSKACRYTSRKQGRRAGGSNRQSSKQPRRQLRYTSTEATRQSSDDDDDADDTEVSGPTNSE